MLSTTPASASAPATGPRPDAVLWDMDGTLVDTEPHWFAAEAELMRSHGLPWTDEDSLSVVGGDLEETGRIMVRAGVPLSVRGVVDELCRRVAEGVRRELELRPGALELLVALRREGIPTALVTNSETPVADVVVEKLGAIAAAGQDPATSWDGPLFDLIVTGNIGLPVKPDPAPYVFAARRLAALIAEQEAAAADGARDGAGDDTGDDGADDRAARPGLEIRRMVAIEDSLTGIRSALGSGALVLGVSHLIDISGSGLDREVGSLAEVTPEALGSWVARREQDRA